MAKRPTIREEVLTETTTIESETIGPAGELEEIKREVRIDTEIIDQPKPANRTLPVSLERSANYTTTDLALWALIRKSSEAMSFSNYHRFIDMVLSGDPDDDKYPRPRDEFGKLRRRRYLPYNDSDAYRLLKVATEAFVVVNGGVMNQVNGLQSVHFTAGDSRRLTDFVELDGPDIDLNLLWLGGKHDHYLRDVRANGRSSDDVKTILYLKLIREKFPELRLKKSIVPDDPEIDLPAGCYDILEQKLTNPCLLELIWSYWHEEGMLVQSMNAISLRFQNIRGHQAEDPLAMMAIDSLRPLNSMIWGYIQDEQHRLSLLRRAYEYDHHYGMTLQGKAVPTLRTADSRSKFLETFHNLLYLCAVFFKEDDDTTVKADGFPVLNAIKDVHLLLSQGAHNQFGDLPATARQEMLVQQWLLARPEFREYLPTRIMVAYPEPWMDRVDAMKTIQCWSDSTVLHFHHLARFGEQVLLATRFGAWNEVNDPTHAANWARYWRPEIQGYYYAYQAVTGVDLTAEITSSQRAAYRYLQPSIHLSNRLNQQQQQRGRAGLTGGQNGRPMPSSYAANRRANRGPVS
jgi:hypothetical protein